jgi:hypothetical protein
MTSPCIETCSSFGRSVTVTAAPAYDDLEIHDTQQIEQEVEQTRRPAVLDLREVRPRDTDSPGELLLGQAGVSASVTDRGAEIGRAAHRVRHAIVGAHHTLLGGSFITGTSYADAATLQRSNPCFDESDVTML